VSEKACTRKADKVLWIGLAAGVSFWFIDSVVDFIFFDDETISSEVFSPGPEEVWLRLVILSLFIAFGVYARAAVSKEAALREAEEHARAATEAAMEKVRASYDFLQSVIDGVAEPMMVVGMDYSVSMMNKAARMLSPHPDVWQGVTGVTPMCFDIYPGGCSACSNRRGHPCPLDLVHETEATVSVEKEYKGADGQARHMEILASPLFGPDGGVAAVVECFRDVTDRKLVEEMQNAHERHLDHIAHHDVLTGLPNRALFNSRFAEGVLRARMDGHKSAVLLLDLDRFKEVNDTMGHSAGDKLLQAVSGRVAGCLRESDCAARLGGDEFTVLMPVISHQDDAAMLAQRIVEALAAPFNIEGRNCSITTSIGVAIYPDDGADIHTLLKRADKALYRAKELGRNNFQLYSLDDVVSDGGTGSVSACAGA